MDPEAHAQQVGPLVWTPWYASCLSDEKAIRWVWPILQDVCNLPDPEAFPVFEHRWDRDELRVLQRYENVVRRLVKTTVLNSDARVRIDVLAGSVTKLVPADDVTVGFAALLRQLFHHSEEASFDRARNFLARRAHEAQARDAVQVLQVWRDAHAMIQKQHVRALMEAMARKHGLLDEGEDTHGGRFLVSEDITPRELVDAFLYGDQLHYGKGRELLHRWQQDETTAAMMEFNMRSDAQTFAHFYSGFGGVVGAVLRHAATSDS